MIEVQEDLAVFEADFSRLLEGPAGRSDAPFLPARRAAFERFLSLGLPTIRQEEWRTTPIAPLALRPRSGPAAGASTAGPLALFDRLRETPGGPGDPGAPRLVFLDGKLHPGSCSTSGLPPGVRIASLSEALRTGKDAASLPFPPGALIGADPASETHPFTLLNWALFEDGAVIVIPPRTVVPVPVHLVFIGSEGSAAHPRIILAAGEASEVQVVETWLSEPGGVSFSNSVAEIQVGPGAHVRHAKLQREALGALHVSRLEVRIEREGLFSSLSVSAGASMARNDINVRLAGPGADATLDGLFLGSGRQHVDNHTVIDHATERATSRETYKGILAGAARGVFDGKIIVREGAQKTDARQSNRNLLLSNDATVDTKPQLEILANDVKCAHAATIGRLDADSIFYLRSRGLSSDDARRLLVVAFAAEVLARAGSDSLRRYLETAGGEPLLRAIAEEGSR